MPRQIDPQERRDELVQAVWRVIRREGVDGASVRAVADEAGLSPGSLRHFFASQSELLVFALQQAAGLIQDRVGTIDWSRGVRVEAERLLLELLPLDAQRQQESEVWLAYVARALVDPSLRPLRDEADDVVKQICRQVVRRLAVSSEQADLQTEHLHALVDGLLLHRVTRPESLDADTVRAVIAHHLDRLHGDDQAPAD